MVERQEQCFNNAEAYSSVTSVVDCTVWTELYQDHYNPSHQTDDNCVVY
jgi:hypothetical protein